MGLGLAALSAGGSWCPQLLPYRSNGIVTAPPTLGSRPSDGCRLLVRPKFHPTPTLIHRGRKPLTPSNTRRMSRPDMAALQMVPRDLTPDLTLGLTVAVRISPPSRLGWFTSEGPDTARGGVPRGVRTLSDGGHRSRRALRGTTVWGARAVDALVLGLPSMDGWRMGSQGKVKRGRATSSENEN